MGGINASLQRGKVLLLALRLFGASAGLFASRRHGDQWQIGARLKRRREANDERGVQSLSKEGLRGISDWRSEMGVG